MFDFRHHIEFKDNDTFSLFGQDYYGDKSTFWDFHQTRLNALYKKAVNSEFPIKITDLITKEVLIISNLSEFKNWLSTHQPFGDSLKEIESRNELIYNEILAKCELGKTNEFEYYWEIWGVMWYPWTIEINNKWESFSVNDISQDDLNELEKRGKIILIKTYEKTEMEDEFDRKRYRIQ